VKYARLVAEGTEQAAEKAATVQIEDEAREAVAALLRDYKSQAEHAEGIRPLIVAAAQARVSLSTS
jgi:hypothetical protein